MKLTIDSTEALEDTLRVVGAVYNVTLEVRDNPATDTTPTDVTGDPTTTTTNPKSPETTATTATRSRSRSRTSQQRKPRSRRARSATNGRARVDSATVRAWARSNGYEIADRGRVSATVLSAYQEANNS